MVKDWERVRQEACRMYASGTVTLDEIRVFMSDSRDFEASERAWRLRFKEWGMTYRNVDTRRKDLIDQTVDKDFIRNSTYSPHHKLKALEQSLLQSFPDTSFHQWQVILLELVEEFTSGNHSKKTILSYYSMIGAVLEYGPFNRTFDPEWCQTMCAQISRKAIWEIVQNRNDVLDSAYQCLYMMSLKLSWNPAAEVLEDNKYCSHSPGCHSVAEVMILHAKYKDMNYYWELLASPECISHIIHGWIAVGEHSDAQFLEAWLKHVDQSKVLDLVLRPGSHEKPQIQSRAVDLVVSYARQHRTPTTNEILQDLGRLCDVETPLKWQLAEIILGYGRGKSAEDCLGLLDKSLELSVQRGFEWFPDVWTMSQHAFIGFKRIMEVNGYDFTVTSMAASSSVIQCIGHVVTKAWIEVITSPDGDKRGQWQRLCGILKMREEFAGLPALQLSFDSTTLLSMEKYSGEAVLGKLQPKLLKDDER